MQNFGVTNKEHYGMLWYFWSGQYPEEMQNKGYAKFRVANKVHYGKCGSGVYPDLN